MRRSHLRRSAFTLVEIMIVVAIIGLLAAVAIPNFVKARAHSQMNACINNLRLIDAAKQQWALEFHQVGSVVPDLTDIGPYLIRATQTRLPICPAAGSDTNFSTSYEINAVTNPPTCLILPSDGHHLPL
jgi:prepilin-type N-terminal cleavage/methylation domain-containing protein